jgi:hypothetical protein
MVLYSIELGWQGWLMWSRYGHRLQGDRPANCGSTESKSLLLSMSMAPRPQNALLLRPETKIVILSPSKDDGSANPHLIIDDSSATRLSSNQNATSGRFDHPDVVNLLFCCWIALLPEGDHLRVQWAGTGFAEAHSPTDIWNSFGIDHVFNHHRNLLLRSLFTSRDSHTRDTYDVIHIT